MGRINELVCDCLGRPEYYADFWNGTQFRGVPKLQSKYLTAAVSDGQCLWAVPEMRAAGLDGMFQQVIVSGDYGFRKPDPRMYRMALEYFSLQPEEVIFVGNDMLRDVHGAKSIGMKTVFYTYQSHLHCIDRLNKKAEKALRHNQKLATSLDFS